MMIFRSMLPVSAAMLLACSSSTNSGSCHAFAPTPLTTQQPAAAGARTGVVLCSSLNHHHHQQHHNNNNNKNNDIEQRPVQNNPLQTNEGIVALREIVPLVFKMGGILIIKTAKDVVQYPPQALDSAIKSINQNQQTSPIVFIVKLLGVLLSKGVADAVYYPTIWTQRMIQCQSLDECDIASYDDNGGNDV